jgi:hypothetical protein
MLKKFVLGLFFCASLGLFSQQIDSTHIKNGIDNPSILATHHFGIFSSRIHQNFKIKPSEKIVFSFNYASGNNFHPIVETYLPQEQNIREAFSQINWFTRQFNFVDQETTPAEYFNIVVDAVIKELRIGVNFAIADRHELGIHLRSYLITDGSYPFSLITSDETIEWFHSNIAGGEDPFGRRFYGLNRVNFSYTDRNGNTLQLNENDFFIGGIELNHYYYPKLSINETRNIFINFGSHLGINTSKFNPSVDIGISASVLKKYVFKNKNEFAMAAGANLLRKNLINFDTVIDLGNNDFLATLEANLEFTKYTEKRNYHAFGLNYQIQSRFNKKKEADYYYLRGDWQSINAGWHNGVTTLYQPQSHWTLIYTYGRYNYKLAFYLKQDFNVNNAPDIQTGFNLRVQVF